MTLSLYTLPPPPRLFPFHKEKNLCILLFFKFFTLFCFKTAPPLVCVGWDVIKIRIYFIFISSDTLLSEYSHNEERILINFHLYLIRITLLAPFTGKNRSFSLFLYFFFLPLVKRNTQKCFHDNNKPNLFSFFTFFFYSSFVPSFLPLFIHYSFTMGGERWCVEKARQERRSKRGKKKKSLISPRDHLTERGERQAGRIILLYILLYIFFHFVKHTKKNKEEYER